MKKNVCPNCGSEINDGELFCGQCGTPILRKRN